MVRRMVAGYANLTRRQRQPEWMDQPGLAPDEHHRALAALQRLNRLSFTAEAFWRPICQLAETCPERPLRVLDLATGAGWVPLRLAKKAARARRAIRFDGCDINPTAVQLAQRQAAAAGMPSRFFRLDVLQEALPREYDVIMCSLFLHHLAEDRVTGLLRRMARATRHLLLVDDLLRSHRGYFLAWGAARLLTRSKIVRYDAPVSVQGAFTYDELARLAHRAGLSGAILQRRWPQRVLLIWRKP